MEAKAPSQPPLGDPASDPTDVGCGCMPRSAPPSVDVENLDRDTTLAAAPPPDEVVEGADAPGPVLPRRAIKIVVTTRPRESERFEVVLAVGADGCDPLFRVIDVDSLDDALAEVPALVAEAETRWQAQQRNPSRVTSVRAKAPHPKDATLASPPESPTGDSVAGTATTVTAEPARKLADTRPPATHKSSDQLTLFG
ncbi:MAG TPA: hypothetical protein VNL16_03410 [Chloroflexota bacterium]|nr:hypothetical protein [Chloroflexota bacterium]